MAPAGIILFDAANHDSLHARLKYQINIAQRPAFLHRHLEANPLALRPQALPLHAQEEPAAAPSARAADRPTGRPAAALAKNYLSR